LLVAEEQAAATTARKVSNDKRAFTRASESGPQLSGGFLASQQARDALMCDRARSKMSESL
jgi:hypothetical protein